MTDQGSVRNRHAMALEFDSYLVYNRFWVDSTTKHISRVFVLNRGYGAQERDGFENKIGGGGGGGGLNRKAWNEGRRSTIGATCGKAR